MGLRNINMAPLQNPSNFRKICMGNWDGPGDPQVYAYVELNAEQATEYLDNLRREHDIKVTINHLIGRILAINLQKYPQLNGLISRKKIYLRKEISVFFQVGMEDAETELVGIAVKEADKKGIVEFAQSMNDHVKAVRASSNHPMRKAQKPFRKLPWRFVNGLVRIMNWMQFDLNLNLSAFGIPQDPFGSIMVTAIGTLGLEMGFVPLAHIGRTPCQVAVGRITKKPVVVDDEIVIRKQVGLCCTFDHRFMDGVLGSKMVRLIKELFENANNHKELLEGKVDIEGYQLYAK